MTDHDDDAEILHRLVDALTERQATAARTDLLSREEARVYVGLGVARFDCLVTAGSIPVSHLHRGVGHRFAPEDLDRWLNSQRARVQTTAPAGIVDLTTRDSPPLAAGPGTDHESDVSPMPSSPRVPERSPLLDSCIHRKEAARYVGLGLRKFGEEVAAGKIPVYQVGRRHLFDPSDLDMYVLTRKYGGSAR